MARLARVRDSLREFGTQAQLDSLRRAFFDRLGDSAVRHIDVEVAEAPLRLARVGGGFNTFDFIQVDGRYTQHNFFGGARRLDVSATVGNLFANQLNGLNPIPAGTEYTVYGFGFVSAGTVITPGGFANAYTTVYSGGTVEVWQDGSPDAAFGTNPPNATVPSTFNDGSLFLRMTVPSLTVTFSKQNSNQNVLGGLADSGPPNCTATAGSALPLLFPSGQPCPLRLTGGWLAKPGNFPAGYSAHYDGKIDVDCPTPATPSTWGRVKSQYQ